MQVCAAVHPDLRLRCQLAPHTGAHRFKVEWWPTKVTGRCHDVFPPHLNPPPGPPSVPRKCGLPPGHDGRHLRDGITW